MAFHIVRGYLSIEEPLKALKTSNSYFECKICHK